MKSALFTVGLLALAVGFVHAQQQNTAAPVDKLYKIDGSTIDAKILEITATEIKYKKASNPDGPTYTLTKSDFSKVVYANGETEEFPAVAVAKVAPPNKPTLHPVDYSKYSDLYYGGGYLYFKGGYDANKQDITLFDSANQLVKSFVNPKTNLPFKADEGFHKNIKTGANRIIVRGKDLGYFYIFDQRGKLLAEVPTPRKRWGDDDEIHPFPNRTDRYLITGKYYLNFELIDNEGKVLSKGKTSIRSIYAPQLVIGKISSNFIVNKKMYSPEGVLLAEFDFKDTNARNNEDWDGRIIDNLQVEFSTDEQFLIGNRTYDELAIWDLTGKMIATLPHKKAGMFALSPDGKMVVTTGSEAPGKEYQNINEAGQQETVTGGFLKFWSMDGKLLRQIPYPLTPKFLFFAPNNNIKLTTVGFGEYITLYADQNYELGDELMALIKEEAVYVEKEVKEKKKQDRAEFWARMATAVVVQAKKGAEDRKRFDAQMNKIKQKGELAAKPAAKPAPNRTTSTRCKWEYNIVFSGSIAFSNIYAVPAGSSSRTENGAYVAPNPAYPTTNSGSSRTEYFVYSSYEQARDSQNAKWAEYGEKVRKQQAETRDRCD